MRDPDSDSTPLVLRQLVSMLQTKLVAYRLNNNFAVDVAGY